MEECALLARPAGFRSRWPNFILSRQIKGKLAPKQQAAAALATGG